MQIFKEGDIVVYRNVPIKENIGVIIAINPYSGLVKVYFEHDAKLIIDCQPTSIVKLIDLLKQSEEPIILGV